MNSATNIVGFIFFGGWSLLGATFYIKAIIDLLIK